jgi:hypothetical protein
VAKEIQITFSFAKLTQKARVQITSLDLVESFYFCGKINLPFLHEGSTYHQFFGINIRFLM